MDRIYTQHMLQDGGAQYVETRQDGLQRVVDADHPTLLAWLAAGNIAQVVPYVAPPGPTLAAVKASKTAEIVKEADAFLASMGQEYGEMERTTWPTQSAEAKALVAAANAPAPMIRKMAAQRGMDVVTLAQRIVANEAAWIDIAGYVIGQRQAYQDQLDAITEDTPENVSEIQT